MDEREFSAIYESIEDDSGSDPNEYVAASHPDSDPGPYLQPEPIGAAPPPPPPDTPPPPEATPIGGVTVVGPWNSVNPLPLPRKPPFREPPGKRHQQQQQRMVQPQPQPQRPKPLKRGLKPKLPPKYHPPGGSSGGPGGAKGVPPSPSTRPKATPPTTPPPPLMVRRDYRDHQPKGLPGGQFANEAPTSAYPSPPDPSCHGNVVEEAEYESIKETRRMLAARKKFRKAKERQEQEMAAAERTAWGGGGGGGGGGWEEAKGGGEQIKLKRLSQVDLDGSGDSAEDVLLGVSRARSGKGGSKVVCVLLSITVVSLLIAVASLGIALYSIAAVSTLNKARCTTETYYYNATYSLAEISAMNYTVLTTPSPPTLVSAN